MEPVIDDGEPVESGEDTGDLSEKTDGEDDGARTPAQSRSPSAQPKEDEPDLFDGYSFKGRQSVYIDDEDDEAASYEEEAEQEENDEEGMRLGICGSIETFISHFLKLKRKRELKTRHLRISLTSAEPFI